MTENLSPITLGKTIEANDDALVEKEITLLPPTKEMAEPNKINRLETMVNLGVKPLEMKLDDMIDPGNIYQYGLYYARVIQGNKAYAVAVLRDGLSIVDIEHMNSAAADLKEKQLTDDPVEVAMNTGHEELMALELATKRVDEGGEVLLGDTDQAIRVSLKDGVARFEAEAKDAATETTLYYPKKGTLSTDYDTYGLERERNHAEFEAFKTKVEKRRAREAKLGRLAARFARKQER